MKEILKELLADFYARTIKDNEEDARIVMYVIGLLSAKLVEKGVLTEEEVKDILES